MNKTASVLLVLCMVMALSAGCAVQPSTPSDEPSVPSEAASVPSAEAPAPSTEDPLYTVEITIPASSFEDRDMSDFDPKLYASEHGYLSAVLNEDGSVTVTMSQTKRVEALKNLANYTERQLSAFVEAT